ncbi:MAG TPA: hypothetical protein VGF48_08555 [Thermoanaerobaculia bacterium]|jgi:hypothetical protein
MWMLRFSLLLLLAPVALAEPLPAFHADPSAWTATDIVVVTEGEAIDGHVTVLETWKGDLRRGDELTIDALAEFAPPEARVIEKAWYQSHQPIETETIEPERVTNARMVLFLVRAGDTWKPAATWMKISMAWVENGNVFALEQPTVPGPLMRIFTGLDERGLRQKVEFVLSVQNELADVIRSNDHHRVISAVRRMFRDDDTVYIRHDVIAALGNCGLYCIPALGTLLGDESLELYRRDVQLALRKANGER